MDGVEHLRTFRQRAQGPRDRAGVRDQRPSRTVAGEYLCTLSGPWSVAAITLSQLGKFAAEILLEEPDLIS